VNQTDWMAARFEANRPHLRAVALRMLGSHTDADDAVQEAWVRLSRSDTTAVENLTGWLTTVVARISLDMLRTRDARREHADGLGADPQWDVAAATGDPEQEAVLSDSVGVAMLVVLETLTPAERLAFVLHDLFAVPFDEIAAILDRSPAAARQLASRARRRVQGAPAPTADENRQRDVVVAFLDAARNGRFEALLSLLDPDAEMRADAAAVVMGADDRLVGAGAVARSFTGRAKAARPALVDGAPALVWAGGGRVRAVFAFTFRGAAITNILLRSDAGYLSEIDVEFID
jgi:RNA polymerase sigma factor (sigma-70 family)